MLINHKFEIYLKIIDIMYEKNAYFYKEKYNIVAQKKGSYAKNFFRGKKR